MPEPPSSPATERSGSGSTYVGGVVLDTGDPPPSPSPPPSAPGDAASTTSAPPPGAAAGSSTSSQPHSRHTSIGSAPLHPTASHGAPIARTPSATSIASAAPLSRGNLSTSSLPPPPARPAASSGFPCDTLWDVCDWELVGRGGIEGEAFTGLAYLASQMRRRGDAISQRDAESGAAAKAELMGNLLDLQGVETEARDGMAEAESSARAAMVDVLEPLKSDITETVDVRSRRVNRRQRKIDALKELLLTQRYEEECRQEMQRRRSEGEWSAFVQKAYVKTAHRMEEAVRREVDAKLAAASEEVGFTPKPPEVVSRERPTLYQHLVGVQLQDAAAHRLRMESADPYEIEMALRTPERVEPPRDALTAYEGLGASPSLKGFIASPVRRGNSLGGSKLHVKSPAETPFSPFGPSPTGPFSPAAMYSMSA